MQAKQLIDDVVTNVGTFTTYITSTVTAYPCSKTATCSLSALAQSISTFSGLLHDYSAAIDSISKNYT